MKWNRFAVLPAAIGVALLLAACAAASEDSGSPTEAERQAVADQLEAQISEFDGVQRVRVAADSPYNSWANVAVRLELDASTADKQSTLVKIGELLLAEPTFDDYRLQAVFDSPHDLPLGSAFFVLGLDSADHLAEESQLWLTITAAVPAVGIVQFSEGGLGEAGVQILPALRPDGTVPSEDEVEAMIDAVTELPHDFFVDTDGPLATQ